MIFLISAALSGATFVLAAPTAVSMPNAVGSTCSGSSYACSVSTSDPQIGAIVQCSNGIFVHIDDCNDAPYNTCSLIGSVPYCVQGDATAQLSSSGKGDAGISPTADATANTSDACTGGSFATVQPGDTCGSVAAALGATTGDVVFVNQDKCGGDFQNNLAVGTVLCIIPGISASAGPTITAGTLVTENYLQNNSCSGHVDIIMPGATCSAIADKYSISLQELVAAAIDGQCDDLEAGDAICIP